MFKLKDNICNKYNNSVAGNNNYCYYSEAVTIIILERLFILERFKKFA